MSGRRRLAAFAIGWAWLLLVGAWWRGADVGADVGAVVRAEFATATYFIVTGIIAGLSALFGGQRVDFGTKRIVEGLRLDVTRLADTFVKGLAGAGALIAGALGALLRGLRRIFEPLFRMLGRLFDKLVRFLDRIFGPLIRLIKKAKFWLQKIYDKVFKPIIDAIEVVRALLRVLAFFGVDWARKLDQQLGRLEQLILEPIQFLTEKLNELANWINRIVTLDGLLQRVMLLRSLIRDVGLTTNLFWNAQSRPLTPTEQARYTQPPRRADQTFPMVQIRQHFATGDAEISGGIRESVANVRIIVRGAGSG